MGARDLIIDSAPILAWRRRDPDAAYGHAPAQHSLPLLRVSSQGRKCRSAEDGVLCRGAGCPRSTSPLFAADSGEQNQ